MRLTAVIAALALLTGCAERGDFSFPGPDAAASDAAIPDPDLHHEDTMKRGLLTGLITLAIGGAGVLLTDTVMDGGSSNAAPEMTALVDVSGDTGEAIAITGSCTDDGNPAPPAAIAYRWTTTPGTTSCTIGNAALATTTATPAAEGTCTLTLTCCDDVFSGPTCTGQSDSDALVATATDPPTPFETLTTALGADHLGHWEVPPTDDATIDVITGRIDRIASMVGGNALQAPSSATRALYQTTTDGLGGEPALELDATTLYLDAALSVAAGNRLATYVVARPTVSGSGSKILAATFNSANADDQSVGFTAPSGGYRSKLAFTTANEVQLALTVPTFTHQAWRLHSTLPLAAGALSQIDGATTTPNFAVSETLRAFDTARIGWNGAQSQGLVKALILVANIDGTKDAAVRAYVAARWPTVGDPLASFVFAGQSNAAHIVLADFVELPGFTRVKSAATGQAIAYWSKAGGGAGYTALLGVLQQHVSTGLRPAVVWAQGEGDSDTEVEADAFLAALELLRTNLETDLGQGNNYIYWVVCRFHSDFIANGAYPYASEVDGHLATFAANHSGHATTIDPDGSGQSTVDGVHWGTGSAPSTAMQVYMMGAARSAVIASGINPRRKKKRRELQRPDRRGWLRVQPQNDNSEALAA